MARFDEPVSLLTPRVAAARRDFATGRISRREMLFRAATAGAGAMTLGLLSRLPTAAQSTPAGATPAGATPVAGEQEPGYSIQMPADLRTDLGGQSITWITAPDSSIQTPWLHNAAAKFTQATGINVSVVGGPNSATDRLQQYRQQFAAQSSDYDCYQMDMIWPGILADFAVDLKPALGDGLADFIPNLIQNNTVGDKLVAIPWFTDVGLLYYRTDLMQKYSQQVPTTWDELEQAAKAIQDGEKASNPQFVGYMWQGAAYEGLTCDGIEWQASQGGGTIVESDGTVSINNPKAIAAFERAKSWIGAITPTSVTNATEDQTLQQFIAGSAAFSRNWPYQYGSSQDPASAVAGKVAVAPLPKGNDPDDKSSGCLGAENIMVSTFSKSPDAAIEFVRYMTSAGVQRSYAIERANVPCRLSVFDDPDLIAAQKFISDLKPIFQGDSVVRPSTVTGEKYADVSQSYFQNLNAVLAGSMSASDAVKKIESDIKALSNNL